MEGRMKVEVQVSSSCPHRDATLAAVQAAMAEAGIEGEPQVVSVGDYEQAKTLRCFGSPTVRVDGVDVEYGDREPEEFTTGCRYYNSPEGWVPVPRKELVLRGIDTAKRRAERAARPS
jgi:hypothetical protein